MIKHSITKNAKVLQFCNPCKYVTLSFKQWMQAWYLHGLMLSTNIIITKCNENH